MIFHTESEAMTVENEDLDRGEYKPEGIGSLGSFGSDIQQDGKG